MSKQDQCKIGYSCGEACINTSYECKAELMDKARVLVAEYVAKQGPGYVRGKPTQEQLDIIRKDYSKPEKPRLIMETTKEFEQFVQSRKTQLDDMLGPDLYEDINNSLIRRVLKKHEPVLYLKWADLERFAKNGETDIKNFFQTGSTNGFDDIELRKQAEEKALGIPQSAPPEARPIYAAFKNPEKRADNSLEAYGELAFKIRNLSPDDYTFTLRDSLDQVQEQDKDSISFATRRSDKDYMAALRLDRAREHYFMDPEDEDDLLDMIGPTSYFEAQIYKPLKFADLELSMPSSPYYEQVSSVKPEVSEEDKKLFDELGIAY